MKTITTTNGQTISVPANSRTKETMLKNFVTVPGDVWTIKMSRNCISDSIAVQVTNKNTGEDFWLGLANRMASWKLLKRINEVGNREVVVQIDKDTPIKYEASRPYIYRFVENNN